MAAVDPGGFREPPADRYRAAWHQPDDESSDAVAATHERRMRSLKAFQISHAPSTPPASAHELASVASALPPPRTHHARSRGSTPVPSAPGTPASKATAPETPFLPSFTPDAASAVTTCDVLRAERDEARREARALFELMQQRHVETLALVAELAGEITRLQNASTLAASAAAAGAATAAAAAATAAATAAVVARREPASVTPTRESSIGTPSAARGVGTRGASAEPPKANAGDDSDAQPLRAVAGVTLERSGRVLTGPELAALAAVVRQHESLAALALEDAGVDDSGMLELAAALGSMRTSAAAPALAELAVSGGTLTHASLQALGLALASLGSLRVLRLARCHIADRGLVALASGLRGVRSLRAVDLSGNALVGRQLLFFAEILSNSPHLTAVDLSANGLTSHAIRGVAFLLLHAPALATLRLRGNEIDDDGAAALADVLELKRGLVELDLAGNPIGARRADALWTTWASTRAARAVRVNSLTFALTYGDTWSE